MSNPTNKNPFDLLLDQIRQVIREELAVAYRPGAATQNEPPSITASAKNQRRVSL
jgi:hypothetical protein